VPKKDVQNRTETLGLREASGKQFYFDWFEGWKADILSKPRIVREKYSGSAADKDIDTIGLQQRVIMYIIQ
jgi:hypothetical protein